MNLQSQPEFGPLLQVAVVLSEKVDTTLSKGVLRIAGTLVGGSLGEHLLPSSSK